jgi:nicotinate phosphoribosyltransferase
MTEYNKGIADNEMIDGGGVTDAYFKRTEEALTEAGKNPFVRAEVSADQFPDGEAEVFCGLKESIDLLSGLPIDVYAFPEGEEFYGGPVMT